MTLLYTTLYNQIPDFALFLFLSILNQIFIHYSLTMAAFLPKRLSQGLNYLFCFLFASFALQTHAQKFPDSSCQQLEGKNSEGQPHNYGDVRSQITDAILEAGLIASTALKTLTDYANAESTWFDMTRVMQPAMSSRVY